MLDLKGLGVCVVVLALNLPAYADRGNGAYKHGAAAERQGDFDAAYKYYKEAHTLSPDNAKYYLSYTQMRFKASSKHIHNGQLLRNNGALKDALTEFQRAVEIDTSDFMAQQELRVTADMMRQQERQRTTPKIESPLAKLAANVPESVELQPISNGPITLKMTATNADVVYKTLGKLAGINVLVDPDYRPQKISIDLNNVTLLEALDMLRLQSKSFWRPVLANTIFVATDSPAKRKEIEENVMKTFYLRNVSTPNELQEAATVVSKMLDVSRVQLLQSQDALMVRGTMDQLVLVEKVLADLDKPKSEVIVDVAVMQVARDRIRTLGAQVPTSATIYYAPASGVIASTGNPGSNGSTSGGAYTVHAGTFATVIPPITLTALASDANSKVLQNPEIRVLNDEKATLRIGDRIPIATGSFSAGVVGAGAVSPLVSTQFQYLDVGVNIDITPHIHGDHEVTLKMGLEISTVTGETNIGGITQPIIGQRRIEHSARLADGEVNLLGGILEDSETQSLSGLPWVSKIPFLKYLFAQENKQRQETEIVFAITPHIVRAREVNEENVRLVQVGTGSTTELRRKPAAPAPPTVQKPADAAKLGPSAAQTSPASAPAPGSPDQTTPSQTGAQNKPGGSV
jgi:general secretion pathway protein D